MKPPRHTHDLQPLNFQINRDYFHLILFIDLQQLF